MIRTLETTLILTRREYVYLTGVHRASRHAWAQLHHGFGGHGPSPTYHQHLCHCPLSTASDVANHFNLELRSKLNILYTRVQCFFIIKRKEIIKIPLPRAGRVLVKVRIKAFLRGRSVSWNWAINQSSWLIVIQISQSFTLEIVSGHGP